MAYANTTVNNTSFAVAFMDATALYLDGISLVGESRKTKLDQARDRLRNAIGHSYLDNEVEIEMAQAMLDKIDDFEKRHLHV